jgi:PAS domain S-box-containing protein
MDTRPDTIRVLHVDDEPDFGEVAARFLERADDRFSVERVTSAAACLDRLPAAELDCIVSDYDMPGSNGLELLEGVRERHPDLPFILFTGKGSEEVASEAISAGVTDYLQKGTGSSQYTVLANRIANAVEQYRSRRELERSQKRLSLMIDQSPLGVVEWDENFDVVRLNDAAEEILGYAEAELRGQSWETIVPASDRGQVDDVVDDLLENRGGFYSINRNVRGDGEEVVCEWHNRVVTDEDGSVVAIFSQFQDVTDREERERHLRELQERTQALLETTTAEETAQAAVEMAQDVLSAPLSGFHLLSEDGQTLDPVAFVDTVREELGEPPVYHRDAEDDPASAVVWETFERGEPLVLEDTREWGSLAAVTPARSGIVHPLADHGVFIVSATEPDAFDETDRALVEIMATSLTTALDRVERETRLRERERQLAAQGERFSSLFETVPEPVKHVRFEDGEPILIDVNPAFEETFGYEAAEVLGTPSYEVVVGDDRQAEAVAIDDLILAEGAVKREVRRQTTQGLGDFLFRSVPVKYSDETEEFFGIYVDISEQKEYERRLERQNVRLEEFASVVSHDLRNPLNVAMGRLELVAAECDSEHVAAVERAQKRMEALIEDILMLARAGETVTVLESVPLATVVEECWLSVDTGGASLAVDAEQTVRADRGQLQRLLENLMRNAVEHGGEDVTVTVGDLEEGFYVEDDGPGIPEADQGQVFDAGFSTSREGTGFGLSIVKRVAEAHGWEIRATAAATGGARFEITGVSHPR